VLRFPACRADLVAANGQAAQFNNGVPDFVSLLLRLRQLAAGSINRAA
jgi:hypothetical protein